MSVRRVRRPRPRDHRSGAQPASTASAFALRALACATFGAAGIGAVLLATDGYAGQSASWSTPRTVSAPHAVTGMGRYGSTRVMALAQRQVSSAPPREVVRVAFRPVGGRFGPPTTIIGTGRARSVAAAIGPGDDLAVAADRNAPPATAGSAYSGLRPFGGAFEAPEQISSDEAVTYVASSVVREADGQ
jgi:hypothetical protein